MLEIDHNVLEIDHNVLEIDHNVLEIDHICYVGDDIQARDRGAPRIQRWGHG